MSQKKKPFENIDKKGENAGNQHFLMLVTNIFSFSHNVF